MALAAHSGLPVQRISELVSGKRWVRPDTVPAWPLALLPLATLGFCIERHYYNAATLMPPAGQLPAGAAPAAGGEA